VEHPHIPGHAGLVKAAATRMRLAVGDGGGAFGKRWQLHGCCRLAMPG